MNMLRDMAKLVIDTALRLAERLLEWFFARNIADRGIVVAILPAFFAIVLPVAKFHIFETWYEINNPLAVYLIGIVVLLVVTMHFRGTYGFAARMVTCLWYLVAMVYLQLARELSHAPYTVTAGYWINIAVALLFLVLSFFSWFLYDR